jgi:hypothetical protein
MCVVALLSVLYVSAALIVAHEHVFAMLCLQPANAAGPSVAPAASAERPCATG